MTAYTWIQWGLVFLVFALLIKPLGTYMARVFTGQKTFLDPVFGPLEKLLFKILKVSPGDNMTGMQYGVAILASNLFMFLFMYLILRTQNLWPLNPMKLSALNPLLAFNTATSFTTNTNWQAYSGENTMSYLSQISLSWLQFTTPATGAAAGIAVVRGLAGKPLGNFWVDITKWLTRVFLPLAMIFGFLFLWQGVPENFNNYTQVTTIAGHHQLVPQGPIASFESIEHLGNNGGGYTNANSANPIENPTALSNVFQILAMGILPVSFFYTFGIVTERRKLAWTFISVATFFFVGSLFLIYFPEMAGNPILNHLGINASMGNMVGKENRFGMSGTSLFETATMAFTTGSVASAHDSYTPLASLAFFTAMFLNMIFGGKGVGLINMMIFAIVTIFLMGLMVGRTPEFMGKKIEAREVTLASIAFLIHPLLILVGTAFGAGTPLGLAGAYNPGPHGFSEILYGFSSGAANNGSAFGGLGAALPFYEILIGIEVVLGRYGSIIAMLILADSLRRKKSVPQTSGTMRVDTPLFASILIGTILVMNALTFFPVLALGPIAEQYLMMAGHLF